jgi:hypothetical protein
MSAGSIEPKFAFSARSLGAAHRPLPQGPPPQQSASLAQEVTGPAQQRKSGGSSIPFTLAHENLLQH